MGKPRLRNKRKEYKELSKRLAGYMMQVRTIYDRLNERAASIVESVGYDGAVEFSFADYPETKRDLQLLQKQFVGDMQSLIYSGTSAEWKKSNLLQDLVANKALKYYRAQVAGKKFKHYYQANSDQLKAFQSRRERGLNLSAKLWNQSQVYKDSLEATISTAIEKGMSAVTLSKRISKYLNDWPSLQADYQEKFGKATNCYDCEYRSIRLARNEINIAYRTAEQLRWQQFDFILGYKIKLSGSHPAEDICDDLQGDYPKNFKFVGWHPNCLCYTVPIVMSEDEYWSDDRENSPNMITEPPDNFTKWCSDNASRILDAEEKGNFPYFIKDNKTIVYNSDVELYSRKYFSKEEIRAFKESTEVGIYHKAVDVDAIFKKNGFTEEEIKEFQSSIKVHQWGHQDQQFNDSEIAVEMWNEKSRIGSLYRLNADIEETAYKLYRKENPPLRIYRAGTMEKDTLSFTTNPQGVEHIVEGESYRWSPDHVRTVDDMMKEYRLFGGIVNKDIGYAGEKELFFVRRERKYLDIDWFNGEIEKRKQKEIKEALELKGDKLKKYEQISSEYMNMFLSNYTKLSSAEINYFSELGKKATNSDEGLMVISKAYEKLKSLLGL